MEDPAFSVRSIQTDMRFSHPESSEYYVARKWLTKSEAFFVARAPISQTYSMKLEDRYKTG